MKHTLLMPGHHYNHPSEVPSNRDHLHPRWMPGNTRMAARARQESEEGYASRYGWLAYLEAAAIRQAVQGEG